MVASKGIAHIGCKGNQHHRYKQVQKYKRMLIKYERADYESLIS
jgi:hypothetical protein